MTTYNESFTYSYVISQETPLKAVSTEKSYSFTFTFFKKRRYESILSFTLLLTQSLVASRIHTQKFLYSLILSPNVIIGKVAKKLLSYSLSLNESFSKTIGKREIVTLLFFEHFSNKFITKTDEFSLLLTSFIKRRVGVRRVLGLFLAERVIKRVFKKEAFSLLLSLQIGHLRSVVRVYSLLLRNSTKKRVSTLKFFLLSLSSRIKKRVHRGVLSFSLTLSLFQTHLPRVRVIYHLVLSPHIGDKRVTKGISYSLHLLRKGTQTLPRTIVFNMYLAGDVTISNIGRVIKAVYNLVLSASHAKFPSKILSFALILRGGRKSQLAGHGYTYSEDQILSDIDAIDFAKPDYQLPDPITHYMYLVYGVTLGLISSYDTPQHYTMTLSYSLSLENNITVDQGEDFVVRQFPFAYDSSNILTGYAFYTPTIGDVLLDMWVEIDVEWNGTTPYADISGSFGPGQPYGWFGTSSSGAIYVGEGDDLRWNDTDLLQGSSEPTSDLLQSNVFTQIYNGGPSTTYRGLPAKFVEDNPLMVIVTQNGQLPTQANVISDTILTLPLTVTTGVNDEFVFTPASTGIPDTFTMPPGTFTDSVEVTNAMAASTDGDSNPFTAFCVTNPTNGQQSIVVAASTPSLPLTITTGVNDTFVYTPISTGIPETFTMSPGTYSDGPTLSSVMFLATGTNSDQFGDYITTGFNSTNIFVESFYAGTVNNGDTLTSGPTDVLASLGFDSPSTLSGGLAGNIELVSAQNGGNGDTISFGSNDVAADLGFTENPNTFSGSTGGGNTGSTQGSGIIYLVTATPV